MRYVFASEARRHGLRPVQGLTIVVIRDPQGAFPPVPEQQDDVDADYLGARIVGVRLASPESRHA